MHSYGKMEPKQNCNMSLGFPSPSFSSAKADLTHVSLPIVEIVVGDSFVVLGVVG